MRNNLKRLVPILLALCMLLGACSSAPAASAPTEAGNGAASAPAAAPAPAEEAAAEEGPFEISWMVTFSSTEPPAPDNPVITELERLGNVKLNFLFSPQAAYEEKQNVTIASGDLPMVMLIGGNGKPKVVEVDAVRNGMFWKIEDYIADYNWPINEGTKANASIDGALWGLYRERAPARDGFIYRKDWMEKLGLQPPKNIDELYTMLDMFVNNDPDGNGAADTGGLAVQFGMGGIRAALGPTFGLGNQWDVVDGKVSPIHMNPQYLELLKFTKRLYDDGLMNKDFPTVNDAQRDEMMATGMWGMEMVSIDKGSKAIDAMQAIFPDSDFTIQQLFADDPDPYIWGRSGFDGKFYFSKNAIPDEATLKRVLDYFDIQAQNGSLISNGVEGVHYTLTEPGKITRDEAQNELVNTEISGIGQLNFITINPLERVDLTPYSMLVNVASNDPTYCRADPTAAFASETLNTKGTDLTLLIDDACIKYVTGQIDDAGWQAEVDRWRAGGGDQIIAEFQAEYDATA